MYKKITLSIILFSSLSFAHNLSQEKLRTLKELTPQEKHFAEKETAKNDLKIAGIATGAAILWAAGVITMDYFNVSRWTYYNCGPTIHRHTGNALMGINLCLALYAAYKTAQGTKHLLLPNHTKPKEISE